LRNTNLYISINFSSQGQKVKVKVKRHQTLITCKTLIIHKFLITSFTVFV